MYLVGDHDARELRELLGRTLRDPDESGRRRGAADARDAAEAVATTVTACLHLIQGTAEPTGRGGHAVPPWPRSPSPGAAREGFASALAPR
jgi:hypothetical protein